MEWGNVKLPKSVFRPAMKRQSKKRPDWYTAAETLAEHADECGSFTNRRMRFEFMKFARAIRPNVFLTLGMSPNARVITFHRQADKFIDAVLQHAHGQDWTSLPLANRPRGIGFLEHPNSNPHFHILISCDRKFFESLEVQGAKIWRRLMTHGAFDAQVIDSEDAVVNYCLKAQFRAADFDNVYVCAPSSR